MKKIFLLQHYFNTIGGVETFLINFCKTFYKTYDITILCKDISDNNKRILEKYVKVITDISETMECDKAIITSVFADLSVLRYIKYKKIYQMVHSDWTAMKDFWSWEYKEYAPGIEYISVSDIAKESFIREYNKDSIVIPNIVLKSDRKILKLCSATRMTEEKGSKRMLKLADMLTETGIDFVWDIYTNRAIELRPGMYKKKPMQQISSLYSMYDYVVQLSDTEAFCYTMYESLIEGVPVLVTPFNNALKEIKEGINGYILPYDMNFDVKKILKIPKNVKYEQKGIKEKWIEILDKPEPKQKYIKLKFNHSLKDKYLAITYPEGTIKEFPEVRVKQLLEIKYEGKNVCEVVK